MGTEIVVLLVLAILGGIGSILYGSLRLLFRLGHRGAGSALTSLAHSSRSLFGPAGPPERLCQSLREKHPELMPGSGGGLSFSCAGAPGRLVFISDFTEIHFRLDERVRTGFEVSSASFVAKLAEDDPDAFRVRGSEDLYRRVFADPSLGRMLREWNAAFEWKFGPADSMLRIRALPRDEEELWRWLKGAFRLLQAVPGFESPTDAVIASVTRQSLVDAECQVCGSSLAQGVIVRCRRCATPHHEECWNYAGECSTFACLERVSLR